MCFCADKTITASCTFVHTKNVIAYPDEVGRGRNFLEAEATPERGEEVQEQEEDL